MADVDGRAKAWPESAITTEGVRGQVSTLSGGRERRRRGAPPEGLSIAAPTRTERHPVTVTASPPGGSDQRPKETSPKLEGRRQATLYLGAPTNRRCESIACKESCEERSLVVAASRSRTTRWVLVSEIGCRHRSDTSSPSQARRRSAQAGDERGSLKRPTRSLAGRVWIAANERVWGETCECQSERDQARRRRKAVDKPMEGALARTVIVLLNQGR